MLELKLRLLADLFPELAESDAGSKPTAHHDTNVDSIRRAITTAFYKRQAAIPREDGKKLQSALELRNDLMHTDFHGARALLHKAGVPPASGGVVKIPIPDGGPSEILDALQSQRDAVPVADLSASAGETYGWLLELGCAGYFDKARDTFLEAIRIVDELATTAGRLPRLITHQAADRNALAPEREDVGQR